MRGHIGSGIHAHIAEMPRFKLNAGNIFLALRIAQDKAVFIAVLFQPFAGLRIGKAFI